MARLGAGLCLKPRKCRMVAVRRKITPVYAARLKAWVLEAAPEWAGFGIVSEALYLGVHIGPMSGEVLWRNAVAKWRGRCLEMARCGALGRAPPHSRSAHPWIYRPGRPTASWHRQGQMHA